MLQTFNFNYVLPVVALFLFLLACIVGFIFRAKEFNQSRFSVFIQMLAPIGIIMVGISIYTDTAQFEMDRQGRRLSIYKDRIEKLFLVPTEKIFRTPNVRPEFYGSFFGNNPVLYQLVQNEVTKPTADSEVAEQYVSMQILQVYEDYLSYQYVHDFEDQSWLAIFIQWAQSQYFRKHFYIMKHNFIDETVAFMELLIEYSDKISMPADDPGIYLKAGEEMYNDPRVKAIHKKIKENKL